MIRTPGLSRTVRLAHAAQFTVRDLPSGQGVELYEVLVDEVETETWLRFRFIAPRIGKSADDLSFEQSRQDLDMLCAEVALPYMQSYALAADVVSIALLDRPVEFGTADPQATQYIEIFRVESGSCAPEGLW